MPFHELLLNSEGAFFLLVTLVSLAGVTGAVVLELRDRNGRLRQSRG